MIKNIDISFLKEERKLWKDVDESCLIDILLNIYHKRKKAVDMYLEGYKDSEILLETGFKNHGEARRLLLKCIKPDEYGNYTGYPALIPYKRINQKYCRCKEEDVFSANKGKAGMFLNLLNNYPELKEYIDNLFFGRDKEILEKNILPKAIHLKFLEKCKSLGIKEYEYPFTVKSNAKRTLYTYLKQLEIEYPEKNHKRLSNDAFQKLMSTGIGQVNSTKEVRPFSIVQIDGHKIDCIATIELKTPDGDIITKTISRFWLLTLIDEATRVILGYHLTIETEYDRFDVLNCIKNAVVPKELMQFIIKGFEYPDNTGFHSLAIPETEWAVFDEIKLDNAKAHLSKDVINQITSFLNASVNFGPVATPERRNIIERFFKTLENTGYHRMVSTTGSGITDVRRRDAEKDAIKYSITFEEIEELTEILIAQYNNSPHSGINGFTPLEVMKQRIDKGLLPNYLEREKRKHFMLNYISTTRKVCGKVGTGIRPYITYEGAEYRSDVLSKSFDLVGRKLVLRFNPDDIRTCKAYFEDGSEFDDLVVIGKWRNHPHSLDQRKAANALLNQNNLKGNTFRDPITDLEQHLTEKSIKHKVSRNKLAALQKTMKRNDELTNVNENSYNDVKDKSVRVSNDKTLLTLNELEARFKQNSNLIKYNI